LQTIRLEIKLGGPDNYEVDMAALAKATGQRTATPPPAVNVNVKRYESDSDGEGAPESGMGTDGGGEKKAKKVRDAYMRRELAVLIHIVAAYLEEEEEPGHRVLRPHGPVHRRLGTRD
jgi:hypothetical protein